MPRTGNTKKASKMRLRRKSSKKNSRTNKIRSKYSLKGAGKLEEIKNECQKLGVTTMAGTPEVRNNTGVRNLSIALSNENEKGLDAMDKYFLRKQREREELLYKCKSKLKEEKNLEKKNNLIQLIGKIEEDFDYLHAYKYSVDDLIEINGTNNLFFNFIKEQKMDMNIVLKTFQALDSYLDPKKSEVKSHGSIRYF